MNSVNWAGVAVSTPVQFKLTWELPNGIEKDSSAVIPIGDPGIHTGLEVAKALVRVWKAGNRGGPHVIGIGTGVHFIAIVTKVGLSADGGANYEEVPSTGAARIVPGAGNDGLCVWRS